MKHVMLTKEKRKGLSRRASLVGGVSASALAGLSTKTSSAQNQTDVIVVGAGLSGLYAALLLEELGYSVQVVEGRDRIGGRLYTLRDIPGNPEAGGNGIGPGYGRVIDTAERLNIPLFNSAGRQDITPWDFYLDGERISVDAWPTHTKNILPEKWRRFSPRLVPLIMFRQTNPLEDFEDWYDPKSAQYDISVHQLMKREGFTDAQIDLTYNLNIPYGMSAHDISALMLWFNAGWSGSMDDAPPTYLSAIGGNMTIPEVMAQALQSEVHLGKDAIGIRSGGSGAEVHCRDGSVYRGKRVVCSVPLPVMRYMQFDPHLPSSISKAISLVPYFGVTQVHLVAKEPFWDADGYSPDMWTDTVAGHVIGNRHFIDRDEVSSLTAWARGFMAVKLDQIPPEDAKAWVVSEIERVRPSAKGKLEAVHLKSWLRDPFAGGGYAAWKPGQISEFLSAVGSPSGRIHFCGEHTALSNRGMEGAFESGERAAFEVMDLL